MTSLFGFLPVPSNSSSVLNYPLLLQDRNTWDLFNPKATSPRSMQTRGPGREVVSVGLLPLAATWCCCWRLALLVCPRGVLAVCSPRRPRRGPELGSKAICKVTANLHLLGQLLSLTHNHCTSGLVSRSSLRHRSQLQETQAHCISESRSRVPAHGAL